MCAKNVMGYSDSDKCKERCILLIIKKVKIYIINYKKKVKI